VLLGLTVATAASLSPWISLFGVYERYAGLLSYLTYVVVFLAVLGSSRQQLPRLLTRSALLALGLTVLYVVLQALGVEPLFSGRLDEDAVGSNVAFFGNVNFAGAWVGMLCGLCLTTALSATESLGWRICAAVLLPASLVAVVLTGTFKVPWWQR
jgi:hypothetical protein